MEKDIEMQSTSFDDIVFEGRNKDYGAYSLRRSYTRNVLIGLSVSLLIIFIFCGYFYYDNFVRVEDMSFSADMLKYADYNIDEELLKMTELDPLPKQEEKPVSQAKVEFKAEKSYSDVIIDTSEKKNIVQPVDSIAMKDTLKNELKDSAKVEEVAETVDTLPKFMGHPDAFRNYLVTKITYPDTSYVRKMGGQLLISFIVNQSGEVENIMLDKLGDTYWGKTIIQAVKMSPRWQPAFRHGKPVKMQYNVPVIFAR